MHSDFCLDASARSTRYVLQTASTLARDWQATWSLELPADLDLEVYQASREHPPGLHGDTAAAFHVTSVTDDDTEWPSLLFSRNIALEGYGGGCYFANESKFRSVDAVFEEHYARLSGGAIAVGLLADCEFSGVICRLNEADDGGCVHAAT